VPAFIGLGLGAAVMVALFLLWSGQESNLHLR